MDTPLRILAMEPYYGGSHQAFLDGWVQGSRHDWTVLSLPPRKWKWRMRHAAITFAGEVAERLAAGEQWDCLWASDMLNVAAFRGLAPGKLRALPMVAYFHENQLSYPVRYQNERDYHFAFTNVTTALASESVWFNSQFHLDSFLDHLRAFFKKMPDYRPHHVVDDIQRRSRVLPPGIGVPAGLGKRPAGEPLHIVWAARWEYDKDPDTFFAAIQRLDDEGLPFRLSVIGERFRTCPPVFDEARERLAHRLDAWGFQPSRQAYLEVLERADVAVSSADHEFFGIGMLEAVAAGAYPVAPAKLAYPEVLRIEENPDFFYDGSVDSLAARLRELIAAHAAGGIWRGDPDRGRRLAAPYAWERLAPRLDDALAAVATGGYIAPSGRSEEPTRG